MLVDETLTSFIDKLASKNPTPGGGSVSALYGALGMALTNMVIALTVNKEKYKENEQELQTIYKKTKELQHLLLYGVDEDVDAFNSVEAVFSMTKNTDEEKEKRRKEMQNALKIATIPPYKIMELCFQSITIVKDIMDKTNKNAISDLGVASISLCSATKSAWLNVLININSIKDDEFKNEFIEKGTVILKEVEDISKEIYTKIQNNLL